MISNYENENDTNLLRRAQAEPSLFSEIYKKYYSRIYRYCYIRSNFNKEEAEDSTSDTFIKAVCNIHKVKLTEDRPTILPWLYTIARNEILQRARKNRTDKVSLSIELIESTKGSTNTQDDAEVEISAQNILKHISELKEVTQDILVMKIYGELSFKEIGETLKLKESTVKMQYYRGIEDVTKKLSNPLYN